MLAPFSYQTVRIRVTLTGPPRVVLGRATVEIDLPSGSCTLDEFLTALAEFEPRIARYLRGVDGLPAVSLRPLLNDRLLEAGTRIPDGAMIRLVYAVSGG